MSSASEKIIKKLVADHDLSENDRVKAMDLLKGQELNILLVGSTGSGKSSTINALFDINDAHVGLSPYPETMDVSKYDFGNLVLWDSPGLGDSEKKDKEHCDKIINLLNKNKDEHALIDLALIILDGSTRDMSTSYKLINEVIIPNFSDSSRIIIAINQADLAYKGEKPWDYDKNEPTLEAKKFLEKKIESIKKRVKESTGINVNPIYYCAGFKGSSPYNLSKLLWLIINNTPPVKRIAFKDSKLSSEKENWTHSDNTEKYHREIKNSLGLDTIVKGVFSLLGGLFGLLF